MHSQRRDSLDLDTALCSLSHSPLRSTVQPTQPNSNWNDDSEDILLRWKVQCQFNASNHFYLGCFYKYVHVLVGLPAVVLPAICSQLNKVDEVAYRDIVEPLLLLSTVCSGIVSVFDFGRRAQQHFHVDQQLSKALQEIDVELRKPRQQRQACEYFIVVTMFKIEGVLAVAPGDGCASAIKRLLDCWWKGWNTLRYCDRSARMQTPA